MATTNPGDLEAHRAALVGHCYRMLGSAAEADDAVQETMVRAWRALDRFEERSSLRTWLYRIATRVCLDLLADRRRRARSMEFGPVGTIEDPLVTLPSSTFVEPIADAAAVPADVVDPHERAVLRQSIRLAFVAAMQHLPPRQRAALILAEVLGWSAAEIADCLETSVAAVNSALQRARATLAERDLADVGRAPLSDEDATLVARWVEAFERYDMEALTALLHEDAVMSMPPFSLWLRGHASITAWMLGRGGACRGSRLVATAANGLPAFGQYKPSAEQPGAWTPWALVVLERDGARLDTMTFFLDVGTLFPRFGLPMRLTDR